MFINDFHSLGFIMVLPSLNFCGDLVEVSRQFNEKLFLRVQWKIHHEQGNRCYPFECGDVDVFVFFSAPCLKLHYQFSTTIFNLLWWYSLQYVDLMLSLVIIHFHWNIHHEQGNFVILLNLCVVNMCFSLLLAWSCFLSILQSTQTCSLEFVQLFCVPLFSLALLEGCI